MYLIHSVEDDKLYQAKTYNEAQYHAKELAKKYGTRHDVYKQAGRHIPVKPEQITVVSYVVSDTGEVTAV